MEHISLMIPGIVRVLGNFSVNRENSIVDTLPIFSIESSSSKTLTVYFIDDDLAENFEKFGI